MRPNEPKPATKGNICSAPTLKGGGGEDTIAEAVKAFLPEARVARLQGPLSTLKGASASARANVTRLPE